MRAARQRPRPLPAVFVACLLLCTLTTPLLAAATAAVVAPAVSTPELSLSDFFPSVEHGEFFHNIYQTDTFVDHRPGGIANVSAPLRSLFAPLSDVDVLCQHFEAQSAVTSGFMQVKDEGETRQVTSCSHMREELAAGAGVLVRFEDMHTSPVQEQVEQLQAGVRRVFGMDSTVHVYHATQQDSRALQPHTDPYDVLVLQTSGSKRWTACVPSSAPESSSAANDDASSSSSSSSANASVADTDATAAATAQPKMTPAQLAQLQEIRQRRQQGCTRYSDADLSGMACTNFTLRAGDVMYMPKGIIHFALANEEGSTHLTVSLERRGLSWADALVFGGTHAASIEDAEFAASWRHAVQALVDEDAGVPFLEAVPTWQLNSGDGGLCAVALEGNATSAAAKEAFVTTYQDKCEALRPRLLQAYESVLDLSAFLNPDGVHMLVDRACSDDAAAAVLSHLCTSTNTTSSGHATTDALARRAARLPVDVTSAEFRAQQAHNTPLSRVRRAAGLTCTGSCDGCSSVSCTGGCDTSCSYCNGHCRTSCACDDSCDSFSSSCDSSCACDASCDIGCRRCTGSCDDTCTYSGCTSSCDACEINSSTDMEFLESVVFSEDTVVTVKPNGCTYPRIIVRGNLTVTKFASIVAEPLPLACSTPAPSATASGQGAAGGSFWTAGGNSAAVQASDPSQHLQSLSGGAAGGGDISGQGRGLGGGVLDIFVEEQFVLYGQLLANGQDASTASAGGGSGGTIRIVCQEFLGGGSLSLVQANGGTGSTYGGAGAGGEVIVEAAVRTYPSALIQAHGGLTRPDVQLHATASIGAVSASSWLPVTRDQLQCSTSVISNCNSYSYSVDSTPGHLDDWARLYGGVSAGGGWSPNTNDADPYLQMNLGNVYVVSGVVTQGNELTRYVVREFEVKYSLDCSTFTTYGEEGVTRTFLGSTSPTQKVFTRFRPVRARCIRIYPLGGTAVGARMDVLGYAETPTSNNQLPVHPSPLFVNGCPESQLHHGTSSATITLDTPTAVDPSGAVLPSTVAVWPQVGVSSPSMPATVGTGTHAFTFSASDGIYATDTCTTQVVVTPNMLTETSGLCPADITITADVDRNDAVVSFTVQSGLSASIAPGSRFHLGVTKVFLYSASVYCSFTVTVNQRTRASGNGGPGIVYMISEKSLEIDAGRAFRQTSVAPADDHTAWLADYKDTAFLYDPAYWSSKVDHLIIREGGLVVVEGGSATASFTSIDGQTGVFHVMESQKVEVLTLLDSRAIVGPRAELVLKGSGAVDVSGTLDVAGKLTVPNTPALSFSRMGSGVTLHATSPTTQLRTASLSLSDTKFTVLRSSPTTAWTLASTLATSLVRSLLTIDGAVDFSAADVTVDSSSSLALDAQRSQPTTHRIQWSPTAGWQDLNIHYGDTVEWVWQNEEHHITEQGGAFSSGASPTRSGVLRHTFNAIGMFSFKDSALPATTSTVVVDFGFWSTPTTSVDLASLTVQASSHVRLGGCTFDVLAVTLASSSSLRVDVNGTTKINTLSAADSTVYFYHPVSWYTAAGGRSQSITLSSPGSPGAVMYWDYVAYLRDDGVFTDTSMVGIDFWTVGSGCTMYPGLTRVDLDFVDTLTINGRMDLTFNDYEEQVPVQTLAVGGTSYINVPVTLHRLKDMSVGGLLVFDNIAHATSSDNSSVFDTTYVSTIGATIDDVSITVSGTWQAGHVNVRAGSFRLTSGNAAVTMLVKDDLLRVDDLYSNGRLTVYNRVVFRAQDGTSPMTSFAIGGSGAVSIDDDDDWLPAGSSLHADAVSSAGTFTARLLELVAASTSISGGTTTMRAKNDIACTTTLSVGGRLFIDNQLTIRARDCTSNLTSASVGSSGVLTLDYVAQTSNAPGVWSTATGSSLHTDLLSVSGTFRAGLVELEGGTLTVGTGGAITMEATADRVHFTRATIGGDVDIRNPVHVHARNKVDRMDFFTITASGSVTLDTVGHATGTKAWSQPTVSHVHTATMRVDGVLSAGQYETYLEGTNDLVVGGTMTFDPPSLGHVIRYQTISVSGTLTVEKPINLTTTHSLSITSSAGIITLDNERHTADDAPAWEAFPPSVLGSTIYTLDVSINGRFKAGYLWLRADSLSIGSTGVMTFDAANQQRAWVRSVNVAGTLSVLRPVRFRNQDGSSRMDGFSLTHSGTVTLDVLGHNTPKHVWTGNTSSLIYTQSLIVAGRLNAGRLESIMPGVHTLEVRRTVVSPTSTVNGVFTFDPVNIGDPALFYSVTVNGIMTVRRPVNFDITQTVSVGGTLTLDDDGHQGVPTVPWDQYKESVIGRVVDDVTVSVSGRMDGGYLALRAAQVTVSGTLTFDAFDFQAHVDSMDVSGEVSVRRQVRIRNQDRTSRATSLDVHHGGTMTLDSLGHATQDHTWTANASSLLHFESISVDGRLDAGRLECVFPPVDTLTVGRTLVSSSPDSYDRGVFTFDPNFVSAPALFTSITVAGEMHVRRPVNLNTTSTIDVSGLVVLDVDGHAASPRAWYAYEPSRIGTTVDNVYIRIKDGTFNAGLFELRANLVELLPLPWTSGSSSGVHRRSKLTFDAFEHLARVDQWNITGTVEAWRHVNMRSQNAGVMIGLTVDVGSTLNLDQVTRQAGATFTGESSMAINDFYVKGTYRAGKMAVANPVQPWWTHMYVSGYFEFLPSRLYDINTCRIANNGRVHALEPLGRASDTPPVENQMPSVWGSGGGLSGSGARGGGYIQAHVYGPSGTHITGTVRANADSAGGSGGGGAGGNIYLLTTSLTGSGRMQVIGGNGAGNGGGGSGGFIIAHYASGKWYSDQTDVQGGTGWENGGSGLAYLVGPNNFRNLRADNRGRSSRMQTDADHASVRQAGAAAFLLPETETFNFEFEYVEVYGAAHLVFQHPTDDNSHARITATEVVGDRTGYLHILPNQTLDITSVEPWKRYNISFMPQVYEHADLILPQRTVEWRCQNSPAYPSLSIPCTIRTWGFTNMHRAHLLVSHGATWQWQLTSVRDLTCVGMTVQDTGTVDFLSAVADEADGGLDMVPDFDDISSDSGRTWLPALTAAKYDFEIVRILNKGELAMMPEMKQPYGLHVDRFEGDRTGVLHTGEQQLMVGQFSELGEVRVNQYAYRYGHLELPKKFECFGITIRLLGFFGGVEDLTPAGYPFRQLFLENAKRDTDPYTRLSGCAGATAYAFDEVHMADSAKLSTTDDTQATLTLTIVDLVSDESTTILVHDKLTMHLEAATSRNVIARIASNLVLTEMGEVRLPPAVQFVGPRNSFAGQLTNAQRVFVKPHGTLSFADTVRTAKYEDGTGYVFISQPSEFKLGAFQLGQHATVTFNGDQSTDVTLAVGELNVGFAARIVAHRISARVGELILQPQSVVDLNNKGFPPGLGPCPGSSNTGAGHGGFAGGSGASCASGAFETPDMPGSGGLTVYGGGLVHIVSSLELRHAGSITVAGQDATSGAGAGGSIYIQASKLTGTGDLAARGGSASSAGSGAGGRIAVIVDTLSQYAGEVYTSGGHGSNDVGAPGTFYFVNARLGSTEVSLQVDNENGAAHADTPTTVIEQTGTTDFVFDRLDILGGARVEFVGSSLRAVELGGDKTGHLLVQNGQRMWVAFSTPRSTSRLVAAHDFTVDEGGELILPQSVAVIGHALHVNGKLTNANRLTIGASASVLFGENMIKAGLNESVSTFTHPVYRRQDVAGELTFDELELLSGSTFSAFDGLSLVLHSGAFNIRTGTSVHQEHMTLDVGLLVLERGSRIDCSGVETQVQPGLCSQCGAGHASHGGVASDAQTPSAYFGTLYAPTTTGYRGSQGGNGGGHIFIQAIDVFVDGVLAVDGASGGGSGGGGSGGSILIEVGDELRGTGVIRADGGNGYIGGSGGRVAVHAAFDLQYSGTMQALGGTGTAGLDAAHGGAGSVFVEDVALGGAVRTVLTIDNANHGHKQVHEIDQHDVHHLNFAELEVVRTGIVRVHPAVQGIMVDVEKLTGDRTTTIHCFANQTWIFDPHDRRVQPLVDLILDAGGEMVFAPHLLYAGTRAFDWRGRVTNVADLDMTRGTTLNFYLTSELSARNLTTWETLWVNPAGTLDLASLHLQAETRMFLQSTMGLTASIGFADLKFGAEVETDFVNATIKYLDVEAESSILLSGDRQLGDSPRGAGSFDGTSASGGGHGSPGGRGSQSVAGGAQYGDLYLPTQTGSRGGNSGGYGGGWMKLSSEYVVVDGLIDVSGQDSVPTRVSGAGSGGSLLIFTDHITGSGDLNVNGGRGLGARQGGGSGGRLAIHVPDAPVAFRGRYLGLWWQRCGL
ncbi:hypothetical protein PTSG_13037 [Salpingoeca rosetta]|uniref:Ribosomal oxygenase 2 n=1 Tax=Salpingoeca rosetta (strain ATCC 50818 / BSB-021) TaxID=946362 RepID=F2UR74_SALR5|nr:uncharacterized protein PTSG_13037 [Salpingoeca rosetta]EGD80129.1 hypothetical protein PTSG_13037 [Salpingoeca rosetta]|eukprot:XP_004988454.1 hypothetical protein PTSG_13037 [Salpingoeca rosetta]